MVWNIAPECISTIVLSIIWIYSRKGNVAPSLKNKLFQLCFLVTFLAMTSNIISTLLLYDLNSFLLLPAWITNTIYFITTPLMGFVYSLYLIVNLYEDDEFPKKLFCCMFVPALLYVLLVCINPWTHGIYSISLDQGYQQGPLILVTYLIFYLYCFIGILMVVIKGRKLEKTVRAILFYFPLIAGLVIIAQLFAPSIILSGSAATIALLMIYLYMQNKQISIDYLTNLPNRQEFLNVLEICTKKRTQTTVLIVSLRDFKRINDVYGQHAGNKFLITLSEYLTKEFKLSNQQLFRYSGDEFAILLEHYTEDEVRIITTTIQQRMLSPWDVDVCSCLLYAAIGIVEYPSCADTLEQIINGIEFSVNLAKKDTSSHHVCYCTKEILHKIRRRQQVADILEECLKQHQFSVFYQPIYSLEHKAFTGAEALLRIPNSPLGPIYPNEFIPIAEESGLIIDMTYMVLDEVCHLLQHMKETEIPIENINVNFSTLQFIQPDLMDHVIQILKEHDIKGPMIKIEITESTLSENEDVMLSYVNSMKEFGIKFGLDDFGTGYSNTSSVLKIPFDTIKLDKSLVWGAMDNQHSAMVVRNLSRTFKDLGFTVLAEGVETQEQSQFVEDCGCTYIQGFLYAKPMNKEDFLQFMANQA